MSIVSQTASPMKMFDNAVTESTTFIHYLSELRQPQLNSRLFFKHVENIYITAEIYIL
jgi:hypothetical protein